MSNLANKFTRQDLAFDLALQDLLLIPSEEASVKSCEHCSLERR